MTEREDEKRNCRIVRNEAWKEKGQTRSEKKTNMVEVWIWKGGRRKKWGISRRIVGKRDRK